MSGFPTYEEVVSLKDSGTKDIWVYLESKYGHGKEKLRAWFRRESEKRSKDVAEIMEDLPETLEKEVEELQSNNSYRAETNTSFDDEGNVKTIGSRRLLIMDAEQEKDPNFVLTAHGFDLKSWVLVNVLNNYWQGMRPKDAGNATLYQSKITVKPKTENKQITMDDISHFFETFDSKNVSPYLSRNVFIRSEGENKIVINLADAHFGNDTESVVRSIQLLVYKVIEKAKTMTDLSEIVFVNLGDLLHIDNYDGQTTSGTQVGTRGTYYEIWEIALKTMIWAINQLKKIAPVKYITVCGNHDKISSYTIGKALEYYFKEDENVDMDCDFEDRKFLTIGKAVFAFVHGDLPAKNVPSILQREYREEYGKSKYAYIFLGHIHHTNILDKDGVIVSHLPSVAPVDTWHKGQAYTGTWKGTHCHVVNSEFGITDTWHIESSDHS